MIIALYYRAKTPILFRCRRNLNPCLLFEDKILVPNLKQTKILWEYQLLSNEWMSNCRLTYIHTYIHTHTHTHIYIYVYIICYIHGNQGPQYKRTRSCKVSRRNLLIQTRKVEQNWCIQKNIYIYFQEIYAKKLLGSNLDSNLRRGVII